MITHFSDRQLEYSRSIIYEVILSEHELAMELFYALQERETDFLAILHQYALKPEARSVRRRDLLLELSAIVFAADAPTLLRPIRTAKASHLIYVAASVAAELTDELRSHIQAELFDRWLTEQGELLPMTLPDDLMTN